VASFDAPTATLRTFVDSSGGDRSLVRYEASLAEAPSLQQVVEAGRPRVVNDLAAFDPPRAEHTRRLREQGYRASYTMPVSLNGVLWGFLFFDSRRPDVFTPEVLPELDVFGHLISSLTTHEIASLRMLLGALKTATDMVYARDPETGAHLERMARFSRLVAQELAERGTHALDDEFIEHVALFAPLHDVGKIGIPDEILLKRDKLTPAEFEVMKTHAERGAEIIDSIIENFRLGAFPFMSVLRHVAACHHESMDGTGYPRRLRGGEIPIEARIVAVADIFDALTSQRPYKGAWSNDDAFADLYRLAETKLDLDCVEALVRRRHEVEVIQAQFREPAGVERTY
jgi:HD-GYP domain-containing protein (c-di-GMP phosphodiesterase class II)